MRCPKCGYISFDYLSECQQCSTDLTGVRQELGLPALQPSLPFLLGPLLKAADNDQGETSVQQPVSEQAFELGAAEDSFTPDLEPSLRPETGEATLSPVRTDQDSRKEVEVSGDSLETGMNVGELAMDDMPVIEFSDDDLEPYLEVKPLPSAQQAQAPLQHGEDPQTAESSAEDMVIELSDDDLEDLLLQLDAEQAKDKPEAKPTEK